jgi:hypothetical protein
VLQALAPHELHLAIGASIVCFAFDARCRFFLDGVYCRLNTWLRRWRRARRERDDVERFQRSYSLVGTDEARIWGVGTYIRTGS